MEMPRAFLNVDMGVKNFKNKSIPSPIPLFELIQDQELNQAVVKQTAPRIDGILPNFVGHFLQDFEEIKWKIEKLLTNKMFQ